MPNPRDLLRPGMFVQAHVRLKQSLSGLMIPQAALQVDQQGTYVFTVNTNNLVLRNNLMTGDRFGENVLVTEGLVAGEKVILRGIQKVRPGSEVQVSDYKPATDPHTGSQPQKDQNEDTDKTNAPAATDNNGSTAP